MTTINQIGKQCIGQVVTDIDDDTFEVEMLEKTEGKKESFFKFPRVPDVRNVKRGDIICKLLVKCSKINNFVFSNLENVKSVE